MVLICSVLCSRHRHTPNVACENVVAVVAVVVNVHVDYLIDFLSNKSVDGVFAVVTCC